MNQKLLKWLNDLSFGRIGLLKDYYNLTVTETIIT